MSRDGRLFSDGSFSAFKKKKKIFVFAARQRREVDRRVSLCYSSEEEKVVARSTEAQPLSGHGLLADGPRPHLRKEKGRKQKLLNFCCFFLYLTFLFF